MKQVNTDDCHLYAGRINHGGYAIGRFYDPVTKGKKSYRIHRLVYESVYGSIPKGLVLDHLCRVRYCINPEHLEAVTRAENNRRGFGISSMHSKKTHCIHGHEFTVENTYMETYMTYGITKKTRRCRICRSKKWKKETVR